MSRQDVLEMVQGSFYEAARRHGIELHPLMTQPLEAELFRAMMHLERDGRIPDGLEFRLEFDDEETCHLIPANTFTWNYTFGY